MQQERCDRELLAVYRRPPLSLQVCTYLARSAVGMHNTKWADGAQFVKHGVSEGEVAIIGAEPV